MSYQFSGFILEGKMIKKTVLLLLLFSLLGFTVNNPSDAGFFKRHKKGEKQSVQKIEKKEEKKIIVVEIFANWCPGCRNIQPTLDQVVKEFPDINFVQLDVSTPSKAQSSLKLAKELGIIDFYKANKSKTSTVAIITPTTKEAVEVFQNNNNVDEYKTAIEEAKTKEKSLENPPA